MITDLELGGVPLHLHRLVRAMRPTVARATVVSLASVGPVGEMLRADGVEVIPCEGRGGWDFRVLRRLRNVIKTVRPDLIHAFLFHANVAARDAARRAGFPRDRVLCEIQTVEIERRWHLVVDRFTHHGCRFTIGNSPSVVEHLAAQARIPRERLRLVRGGIDPAPYREASPLDRSSLGLQLLDRVVVWVGRLDPVKGLTHLIEAFFSVFSATGAHLLLAGEGPFRLELERQIARHNLDGHVHLLGARRDVARLLKTADVFVFPSQTEGLPNALLEAMAASRPIVTTDVPGCRDLIRHEETGLVVPYGHVTLLASCIRRLLDDPTWAASLADRAFLEVSTNWHFDQTMNSYSSLYHEVLPSSPS